MPDSSSASVSAPIICSFQCQRWACKNPLLRVNHWTSLILLIYPSPWFFFSGVTATCQLLVAEPGFIRFLKNCFLNWRPQVLLWQRWPCNLYLQSQTQLFFLKWKSVSIVLACLSFLSVLLPSVVYLADTFGKLCLCTQ